MAPLIQSPTKKAFDKNVRTEMDANPNKKDRAQNLAIAYSIQRKNRKARGGMIGEKLEREGDESAHREMVEPTSQRLGDEAALAHDERESDMEMGMRKKMARGGMAEPEWQDAGELGFPMLEEEDPSDEYSKEGIINYAMGGEVDEPTSQRLGSERYLDDLERPIERHGMGEGMRSERESLREENPSIAESIRRKYMARGGMIDEDNTALDQNAVEHTNYMNKLNRQLGDHEMYKERSALNDLEIPERDGMDSRHIPGDNEYDMVGEIRKKYMRDRMRA